MLVIGGEHAAAFKLPLEQGHQRFQVLRRRSFADHDKLTLAQLFQRVFRRVALVVGVYACGGVRIQRVAGKSGRVAVNFFVMRLRYHDFLNGFPVAADHAGIVHHLCQTQHPRVVEIGVDVPPGELFAVFLKGHGRHAAGQHEVHVHRQPFRSVDHVINARYAANVGNFVRVGNHGGGAVG